MKAAEATRRKRFIIEHSRDKFTCGKQPLFQIWSQLVRNLATFGESAVRHLGKRPVLPEGMQRIVTR